MKKRYFVTVTGIVQGVGFRPFVYNLALSLKIKGWVNNNSEGVYIDIEGEEEALKLFLNNLEASSPPLSRIESVETEEKPLNNYTDFLIKESVQNESKITLISPDIAICCDCLKDIKTSSNRRFKYPFTNCTNCGPRYSIIKTIPYDRDKTTMAKFNMCNLCSAEYADPTDRRFHAQPNACDSCGPHLFASDKKGNLIEKQELENFLVSVGIVGFNPFNATDLVIKWTQEKLKAGAIFAVKGLTGFNLVCDANNPSAVNLLRERKRRPHKPFAVMMDSIDTVKEYCCLKEAEERLLTGRRKPIILLNKKNNCGLPFSVAPNQRNLGVMLPYTPLHELLLSESPVKVLIMTSANIHGLPLEYINEAAVRNLDNIADYFLMHDRDIHIPVDDSVTRVVLGEERIIRRARGYAPEPLKRADIRPILACGSNMKNTFCIAKDNFIFLSQHNGDLENLETFEHYKNNIKHFKNIFAFEPKYLAADLHPEYASTKFALESDLPVIQVQHHHAHIVSCMAENLVSEKLIGVSFDGTGYGTDGKIWGGEFLISDYKGFIRAGHLNYFKLPGIQKAVEEPWRMAVSYLYSSGTLSRDELSDYWGPEASLIVSMLEKNINCIETSSMGRLFDAVSAILGLCQKSSYEGQASMELEAAIGDKVTGYSYSYKIEAKENIFVINTDALIREIWEDRLQGIGAAVISRRFHDTIVSITTDMCKRLRELYGLNDTALSGGVFQNAYLLKNVILSLEKEGFTVYSHKNIPSNDGGICLGQIITANEIIKDMEEVK